nr:glycoprotein [Human metapneumovirus]
MGQVAMEVRVENIRAIDMFKAKMKNRIRSSKCYRNATLILIGLTALSMALNIFLIIDYATLKNMTKVEHCVNMPPVEPSKKTPMTSAVDLNTKLNLQQATQLTTEDSTSLEATSENHLHTGTTPISDATISQQTTDEHTTLLRSINRQTIQTTTEKKPTGATTKKKRNYNSNYKHSCNPNTQHHQPNQQWKRGNHNIRQIQKRCNNSKQRPNNPGSRPKLQTTPYTEKYNNNTQHRHIFSK